jgi:hypothetical protein
VRVLLGTERFAETPECVPQKARRREGRRTKAVDFNRWYRPSSDAAVEGRGRRRMSVEDWALFELSCSVGWSVRRTRCSSPSASAIGC